MSHHHRPDVHITEHHFGSHDLIKYDVDDSSRSCFYGFIKFPRLRQYFVFDPSANKRILVREKDTRKISWTELFYDLIYVVLIEHLASTRITSTSSFFFLDPFGVFGPQQQIIIHKIYYLLQMTAVVSMGINLHDAQESPSIGFAASYLAAKLLLVLMYLFTAYSECNRWHNALYMSILNTVLIVPWIFSLIFPEYGYLCWAISLCAEELSIFVSAHVPYRAPLNIEHYIERVGVFVILLLGMMVVALLAASENHDLGGYLGAFIPLFLAFALKWTYFDIEGAPKKQHAVRKSRFGYILWMFCHLPLMLGICFSSAGLLLLEHTIGEKHDEHPYDAQWLISGGVGAVMISMGLMGYLSKDYSNFVVPVRVRLPLRIATGVIVILLGFTHRMYANRNGYCDSSNIHDRETTIQFLGTVMGLVFGFTLFELIGSVQKKVCTTQMQHVNVESLHESTDSSPHNYHSHDSEQISSEPLLTSLEDAV